MRSEEGTREGEFAGFFIACSLGVHVLEANPLYPSPLSESRRVLTAEDLKRAREQENPERGKPKEEETGREGISVFPYLYRVGTGGERCGCRAYVRVLVLVSRENKRRGGR